MDPVTTTVYSRDVAVAAITKFLTLVARLYALEDDLEYPPAGGWPEMTPDACELWGMTSEAFDLVRHIPYFRHQPPCIMFDCRPHTYRHGAIPWGVQEEGPAEDRGYPPHIFPFANNTSRYGCIFLIDVKHGSVIWYYIDGAPPMKGAPQPDAPCVYEQEDFKELYPEWAAEELKLDRPDWMYAPTFRIETFFAIAEEQLIRMNWLPLLEAEWEHNMTELRVYGEPDDEQQDRMQIMRDSGWPGDKWDWRRAVDETEEWVHVWYRIIKGNGEMDRFNYEKELREQERKKKEEEKQKTVDEKWRPEGETQETEVKSEKVDINQG